MTIPQSLAKEIKKKCTSADDYFLAVRRRLTIKINYFVDLFGEQPSTGNTSEVVGDFTWKDAEVKYTSKPVITRPSVNVTTVLQNITGGSRANGTYAKRFDVQQRSGTNIVINGTVYDFNGVITFDSFSEGGDFRDAFGNLDNEVSTQKDVRTSKVDVFVVGCKCSNGEELDCPSAPNGFCCIPYRDLNLYCAKLNN